MTEEMKTAVSQIVAEHGSREGPLLPILHALKLRFGYVPREALPEVAQALNLSRAEVFGAVSFYHDFRFTPPGKHTVKLCRAEACQSMGAVELAGQVKSKLGIGFGETTPDGKVSLDEVYCLGLCATAPAAMVDGAVVGRLDGQKVEAILKKVAS